MITSNKYVSIFSPAEGFIHSFLIIDQLEQDHLKRIDELKLNKSVSKVFSLGINYFNHNIFYPGKSLLKQWMTLVNLG